VAKRFTDTEKWADKWLRELPVHLKLFWIYICDRSDHAGIWKVDMPLASFQIGEQITEGEALLAFEGRVFPTADGSLWVIPKFIRFQYGQLVLTAKKGNKPNKVHLSVARRIRELCAREASDSLAALELARNLPQKALPEPAAPTTPDATTPFAPKEVMDWIHDKTREEIAWRLGTFYAERGGQFGIAPAGHQKIIARWLGEMCDSDNPGNHKFARYGIWRFLQDIQALTQRDAEKIPFKTVLSNDNLGDTKRLYSQYMDAVRQKRDKKATDERTRKGHEAEQHAQEEASRNVEAAENFHDGDEVTHETWGKGVVKDGEVLFSEEWFPGKVKAATPLAEIAGELERK